MNKEEKNIVPELRFPEFKEDKWDNTNLGSIGKPLMCKRIFKEETTTNPENAVPFFKIGTFGAEPDAYIPMELYEEYKKKYSFPKIGDILISASGTIGRLVVYDGSDAYYQDSNIVWLGHNEKKVLNSYLYYCYNTLNWQTSDGGVIKRLYNSNLKEMEIFYPQNPAEQQKIAACLSSLDEVFTAETEKLDLLQDHKKGLLQQLFPAEGESQPKYRFPEFKKDGDWEEKPLKEVVDDFIVPMRDKPKDLGGKIPWCRIEDFDGIYLSKSKTNQGVSEATIKEMNLKVYPIGTLLVSCSADLGRCSITSEKLVTNQTFIGLVPNEKKVVTLFLYYVMSNAKTELNSRSSGTTISYLSRQQFEKFEINIPSPKEQQKISRCLSAADALIEAQAQKIEALQEHKKGLLQQLFPNVNEVAV